MAPVYVTLKNENALFLCPQDKQVAFDHPLSPPLDRVDGSMVHRVLLSYAASGLGSLNGVMQVYVH